MRRVSIIAAFAVAGTAILSGLPARAQSVDPPKTFDRGVPPEAAKSLTEQSNVMNEAQKRFLAGEYDEALVLYKKAFDIDGDWSTAYSSMIDCHLKLGREKEALAMYDELFRPQTVRSEKKPIFRFGSTSFAARRGMDYVMLLLDAGRIDTARSIFNRVKTDWLKESGPIFPRVDIPFDDTLLPPDADKDTIRFHALLVQGTEATLRDFSSNYGEPTPGERLALAARIRPENPLVNYLRALDSWKTVGKAELAAPLVLKAAASRDPALVALVKKQWLTDRMASGRWTEWQKLYNLLAPSFGVPLIEILPPPGPINVAPPETPPSGHSTP